MIDRPVEFFIALFTGMAVVFERHKNKPLLSRTLISSISGGIGYSFAKDFAEMTGRSETLCVMLLTAVGYLLIDSAMSLISDREFLKQIVLSRIGKGGSE